MMSLVIIYDQMLDRWIVVSVESSRLMQSEASPNPPQASAKGSKQRNQ